MDTRLKNNHKIGVLIIVLTVLALSAGNIDYYSGIAFGISRNHRIIPLYENKGGELPQQEVRPPG